MAEVKLSTGTPVQSNPAGASDSINATAQQPVAADATVPASTPGTQQPITGLSQAEIADPNAIRVNIADSTSPIVILFGPPGCGKTMTLVRLARYLRTIGFKLDPVSSFRPSFDTHYARMCQAFPSMIGSDDAADSTQGISFMLVRVLDDKGRVKCQILEAPGEYYYNPNNPLEPNVGFPAYLNTIKNNKSRKIWCFMVEPQWQYLSQASGYVAKIAKCKGYMRSMDKVIFVLNKIDQTPFLISPGEVNMKSAKKEVMDLFPGIFTPFQKSGVFGKSDGFSIVPFQTGDYTPKLYGGYSYQEGPDEYPKALWNTIMALVRG